MPDFTANMTSVAELDNSIFTLMDQAFVIAAAPLGIMDQLVSVNKVIGAKAIEFPKYAQIAVATTPLTDSEDAVSSALSDSQIILTPLEYGAVVTKTKLLSAQSGGKADLAAAQLVGINMQRTLNNLAILACEAGSNKLFGGTAGSESALTASDVMSTTLLNKLYNKLTRSGVQPLANGQYVCVMHSDQLYDLRNSSGSGSWQDIAKYGSADKVLLNEVGSLCGFKIIEDGQVSTMTDSGSGAVDGYYALAMGYNALGKAISLAPQLVLNPAGDKLARFMNVGWHGILKYGIIDSDALWLGVTASSVGSNT